jgi:diguanylate cyclase (GGDEF)-like protein
MLDGAVELSERLRQQIQDHTFVFQQDKIQVTISIGIAELSDEDRNAGELLKRADERLYQAKNSGRNRVCS